MSIKVDREERPDVDRVYMTFVQATTGSGGWPMSVWLTPELKPFYGGTYFPPTSRWGRPGFVDILGEIARVWQHDRAQRGLRVGRVADRAAAAATGADGRGGRVDRAGADALARRRRAVPQRVRSRGTAASATRRSSRGRRELLFLLREHARTGDADARDDGAAARCARWRSAACAITSAAASIAIRWTPPGACRTSRRCCTTRRSWCSRTSKRRRPPAIAFYVEVAEDTLRYVHARDDATRTAGSIPRKTPTAFRPSRPTRRRAQDGRRVLPLGARRTRRAARRRRRRSSSGASASSRTATRRAIRRQEFTGKNLLYIARVDRRYRGADRPDADDEIVDVARPRAPA